jgi:hypothetical protein
MAKNQFTEKHFHDEDAARAWFEFPVLFRNILQLRGRPGKSAPKQRLQALIRFIL